MGALERDNEIAYDENSGDYIDIGNTNASPMAVTSRSNISSLLGGEKDFQNLIKNYKIFIYNKIFIYYFSKSLNK